MQIHILVESCFQRCKKTFRMLSCCSHGSPSNHSARISSADYSFVLAPNGATVQPHLLSRPLCARLNGLDFSGGAPLNRESLRFDPNIKNAPILWAQSAVRCKPLFSGSVSLAV